MTNKDFLNDFPLLHPRHDVFNQAEFELMKFTIEWENKHQLSVAEMLELLSGRIKSITQRIRADEWKESRRETRKKR